MSQLTLSEFADRVEEIMPVMAKEFFKYQPLNKLHKVKVSMPQFFILGLLRKQGESNMTDMARYVNVTTAAMTGLVERLVRDGYAVRVSDPRDRRVVKVKATAKGAKLVDEMHEHRKKALMGIFDRISQKERETYLKILMHLKDHLK